MTAAESLRAWILEDIQDDILSLSWLDGLAMRADQNLNAQERRNLLAGVLSELLEKDLILVGIPKNMGNSFSPWPGQSDQIISRLLKEWESIANELVPGDVAWIARPELADN